MTKKARIVVVLLFMIAPVLTAIDFQIKVGIQLWAFVLGWPEIEATLLTSPIISTSPTHTYYQQEIGAKLIFGPRVFHAELINRSWFYNRWSAGLHCDVRLGIEYYPALIFDPEFALAFGSERFVALRLGMASSFSTVMPPGYDEIFIAPGWYFPIFVFPKEGSPQLQWPWDPWSWTSAVPFIAVDYALRWTDL